MSKVFPLQNAFQKMVRDTARNRMAPGACWNLVDVIPDYDAPARERGGYAYANAASAISAVSSTASYIRGGIFATFSPTAGANPKNLALDEDGVLYAITTAGVPSSVGAALTIAQNPVFHGGVAASAASAIYTGLVIIPDSLGASVPKKYDGTTLSNLGGSPPKARYATVYKDYTILGNGLVGSVAYPNRVWFSPPGDPDCGFSGTSVTAWDTTDSWQDFSLPVIGLASTKNVFLIFHDGQISRMRGSSPPPDEDMTVDDPWQSVGLLDPFSITNHQDMIYFCAAEGVYRTDGVTLDDITLKGGMLRYWLDLAAQATSSWTFATGVVRNKLMIAVMDGNTFKDAFLIDLNTYGWTRLSNIDAVSFWTGLYNKGDECFFARRGATYVGRTQTMFSVGDATYKSDANGTAVASVIETPFFEIGRPGIKIIKSILAGFFLRDFASDNPTIAVSYIDTPEATSYTALGTLSENTKYDRRRVAVGGRHWGIALKFARANAGDFYGFDLSTEASQQEESKRLT